VIPARIEHGHDLITIVTAMFMHAGWLHILGNMVFLWAFGPAIEDAMGRFRYLVFYLMGGAVAMMAQVMGSPGSTVPCLGASGTIAAVMGAFIVIYPRDRIRTLVWILIFIRVTYIPAVLLIGFWFLIQLLNVVGSVATVETGGVAYLAHVGGFVFGVVTARVWRRKAAIDY
jgi:membrane associated rhomboid family serine protease